MGNHSLTKTNYSLKAIKKKGKRKGKKRQRRRASAMNQAARAFNMSGEITLDRVYIKCRQALGEPFWVESTKDKNETIARFLNRRKQGRKTGFYDSREWKELRFKAFEIHGNRCMCCGAGPDVAVLHVDHIKPRSKYPELQLRLDNLQILCEVCNLGKSNKSNKSFL